jgi:alpha-L-rhamnosidase
MAGIDTEEAAPGYQRIRIMPHFGGNFTEVKADYKSNYGLIASHWRISDNKRQLLVEIPANTVARIYLPTTNRDGILEDNNPLTTSKEVKFLGPEGDRIVLEVGSGKYSFSF